MANSLLASGGGSDFSQIQEQNPDAQDQPVGLSGMSGDQPPSALSSSLQPVGLTGADESKMAVDMANQFSKKLAMDGLRDFGARAGMASKMAQDPLAGATITKKPDGTIDFKGLSQDAVADIRRELGQLNEIRGSFAAEADRLRQQEEKLRTPGGKIMSLLTNLSANLSQQRDMPGWVQGLGQTAAQMNPTADALRSRRLGLLKEEAGLAERSSDVSARGAQLGMEQTREQRLTKESALRQQASFQSEHVSAAIRGEGDPAATTKLGVEMGVIPPEQAEAFQQNLEALKKSYFEKKDAADRATFDRALKLEMAKAGVAVEKQTALFNQQDKLLDKRLAVMSAMTDKKAAAAEAKGKTKEASLKDFEVKELEQYVSADKALDEVEALLKTKEAQKVMGPYSGRMAKLGAKMAPSWADPQGVIKGIDSKLRLQTAQAIKSTGAGARGFGPMERPFFEGLAEGITNTPAQNQKIIDTWREYLDQGRKGILANHTDETLQKYPKMFGSRIAGQPVDAMGTSEAKKYPWEK